MVKTVAPGVEVLHEGDGVQRLAMRFIWRCPTCGRKLWPAQVTQETEPEPEGDAT